MIQSKKIKKYFYKDYSLNKKKHFSLKKLVMPIIVLISFYGIVTIFQIVKFPFYIFTIQDCITN